ncbi:MAG: hypothetical protein WAV48_04535 [Candidatus Magasanikiibacteriota bacterium]
METNVHQIDTKKEKGIKELSAEWFEVQQSFFFPGNTATDSERMIYHHGMQYLSLLKQVTETPPMIDEVEVLKHYVPDPHCKTCHGKGRIGINLILDKEKKYRYHQLQLCYCVEPVESEFARVMHSHDVLSNIVLKQTEIVTQLIEKITEMNKIQTENTQLLDKGLYSIDQHTAGFWIDEASRFVAGKCKAFIKLFTMKEEHAAISAEEVHQSAQQD